MRRFSSCLAIAVLAATASLPGCTPQAPSATRAQAVGITFNPPASPTSHELIEDRSVYDRENLAEVPVINVTVWDLAGFARVNSNDPPDAEVAVRFQQGTFGEGTPGTNGVMSLRGTSTRLAILKSYKIKLEEAAGRWRDQKTIHLLKNPWDLTRVRNYLAFEYFKTLRHLTSMRHQFVRVYINGQDYGLYEWYESSSKRFLSSHGLDEDGTLYKANDFVYHPWRDDLFECDDPEEQCLEIEENHDPDKLRRMLDAVNDMDRDIDDIIDEHFQRDNYETWLAVQILFTNYDSASQNYFLYSPSGSERWYYLPWDYNGAFGFRQQPDWQIHPGDRALNAPGYWWKVFLHQRYLSKPENVESLHQRILALRESAILDSKTRRIQATVHDIVRTYAARAPDLLSLPVSDWGFTPEQKLLEWEGEWARLGGLVSAARHEFERTMQWPMPTWLGTPRRTTGGAVRFRWDPSFDLQGDDVTYDFVLGRRPELRPTDIMVERRGLRSEILELPSMPAGTYYYKLTVRDSDDPDEHWVNPFTRWFDIPNNRLFPGVKRFTLP